jgi:hypothetical protein
MVLPASAGEGSALFQSANPHPIPNKVGRKNPDDWRKCELQDFARSNEICQEIATSGDVKLRAQNARRDEKTMHKKPNGTGWPYNVPGPMTITGSLPGKLI